MRKLIYLPAHFGDRLLKFRKRHEMMDEQIALIRLVDAGLKVEEEKYTAEKATANDETKSTKETTDKFRALFLTLGLFGEAFTDEIYCSNIISNYYA